MNEVLFRKIERLKEEILFLKSGLSDIEKFIGFIGK